MNKHILIYFLGEVLGFENLVFSIFDFINTLIESSKYRHHVKNGMADLLYYTLLFMQMTEDQVSLCYQQLLFKQRLILIYVI